MQKFGLRGFVLACLCCLASCAGIDAGGTLHKSPAALQGDFSGKDFSGTVAFVPDAYDIPGVPASNGKRARWSQLEHDQVLHIDAHCQRELFATLPDWAQAIVKEGGWGALATAVGEAGFAAAFPGADIARYFLGGIGLGAVYWANDGRIMQDQSEKASQGYCVLLQTFRVQQRYQILRGWVAIPWVGPGHTSLPKARDDVGAAQLSPDPKGSGDLPPFPPLR